MNLKLFTDDSFATTYNSMLKYTCTSNRSTQVLAWATLQQIQMFDAMAHLRYAVTGNFFYMTLNVHNHSIRVFDYSLFSKVVCSSVSFLSLIAYVHGKVSSLSKSSWLVQPITEQLYYEFN